VAGLVPATSFVISGKASMAGTSPAKTIDKAVTMSFGEPLLWILQALPMSHQYILFV